MANNTKDIAYYWKSKRDESKMKTILYSMKNKDEVQKTLDGRSND